MSEIVVVGSLNLDLTIRLPRFPLPGETIAGREFRSEPGGKGANQAAAAARLGAATALVGRVGDDPFGQRLRAGLGEDGVDVSHVHADPREGTGVALVQVAETGENTIVIAEGANGLLAPGDVDAAAALFEGSKCVLLQHEVPEATLLRAAERAKAAGARVLLNAAPARPTPRALLKLVDVLVVNEREAEALSGVAVPHAAAADEAARALARKGAHAVAVTLGARGAFFREGRTRFLTPAPVVNVVDTTAAGDAFTGGLAVALARGLPPKEALRFAVQAGTLAVTRAGARASLPTLAEVEAALASPA
jgi:ribokinase